MSRRKITNPFYEKIIRDGIHIKIERPQTQNREVTNPYYERIKREGIRIRTGRGRPRKNDRSACATVIKSIRLTPEIWKRVDAQAVREGITRHAAARQAILIWLQS